MGNNSEWYRTATQHMWRTYFAIEKIHDGTSQAVQPPSDADMRIHAMCDGILQNQFTAKDKDILRMYFTSRWGDDIRTVEDYSLRHNVPVNVIWIVVKRACRSIMEELGLVDRKEISHE